MKFKKILYIILWIGVIVGIGFLMAYSYKSQKRLRCKSYSININIEGEDTLLLNSDVERILSKTTDSIVGKRYSKINFSRLEIELKKNLYVTDAEVFCDLSGNISINLTQFNPIVRLVTNDFKSYYLDKDENMIPSNRSAYVIVANGNFEIKKDTTFTDLLNCVQLIRSDAFLYSQIGQIYLTPKGIYKLYPVVGDHEIVLGRPDNFEEGLLKLKLFYEKGIDKQGWKEFKSVDVRFKDQVVCAK